MGPGAAKDVDFAHAPVNTFVKDEVVACGRFYAKKLQISFVFHQSRPNAILTVFIGTARERPHQIRVPGWQRNGIPTENRVDWIRERDEANNPGPEKMTLVGGLPFWNVFVFYDSIKIEIAFVICSINMASPTNITAIIGFLFFYVRISNKSIASRSIVVALLYDLFKERKLFSWRYPIHWK